MMACRFSRRKSCWSPMMPLFRVSSRAGAWRAAQAPCFNRPDARCMRPFAHRIRAPRVRIRILVDVTIHRRPRTGIRRMLGGQQGVKERGPPDGEGANARASSPDGLWEKESRPLRAACGDGARGHGFTESRSGASWARALLSWACPRSKRRPRRRLQSFPGRSR